jgi:hypothetical protein
VTEAQTNPVQSVIDEFKNLCPETSNILIFRKNGQVIGNTQATTEDQTKDFIFNFSSIVQRDQAIGGIESLTIQAKNNQLCITTIDSFFLATVSSRTANQKILKSLTHVVVPTVVKLVDKSASFPVEDLVPQPVQVGEPEVEENLVPQPVQVGEPEVEENLVPQPVQVGEPEVEENLVPQPVQVGEPEVEETSLVPEGEPAEESIAEPQLPCEPILPATPVSQFMVEKIGGILNPSDLVRIDREVISKWIDLYDGIQIKLVNIETLDGQKTTCEFRPIRDTNFKAKGIIQIPEKILKTIRTENGQLVLVKPVIT